MKNLVKPVAEFTIPVLELKKKALGDLEEIRVVGSQVLSDEGSMGDSPEHGFPVLRIGAASFKDVPHDSVDAFGQHLSQGFTVLEVQPVFFSLVGGTAPCSSLHSKYSVGPISEKSPLIRKNQMAKQL